MTDELSENSETFERDINYLCLRFSRGLGNGFGSGLQIEDQLSLEFIAAQASSLSHWRIELRDLYTTPIEFDDDHAFLQTSTRRMWPFRHHETCNREEMLIFQI
jgi:hypothetical protein